MPEGINANATNEAPASDEVAPAAPTQPPADSSATVNAALQAMMARLENTERLLTGLAQPRAPEPPPAEDTYIDPQVAELSAGQKQMRALIAEQQDHLDQVRFHAMTQGYGLGADTVQQTEGLYNQWLKQGVTISGRPPTRGDALYFMMGQQALTQTAEKAKRGAAARAENVHATLEGSGTIRRAPANLDPEKLSRDDRLDKYWPALLDEEGF